MVPTAFPKARTFRTAITDLGLNDFRMDLLNHVKEHGELENVPFGMHALVPAQPQLGIEPGVIFALKNIHDSANVNQQNRLHPYYLVYIGDDGDMIADHTEVKRLLDLVRTTALTNTIKGLDDFEVIAFLIIERQGARPCLPGPRQLPLIVWYPRARCTNMAPLVAP